MTIYPQAILGMIEIDQAVDKLVLNTSAGVITLTPTRYTYANVIDLMWDLNNELDTDGDLFLIKRELYQPGTQPKDFVAGLTLTTGTLSSISSGVIKDILFHNYGLIGSVYTSTETPLYSWIPTYRSSDGNWFEVESASVVKGSIGVSGNLSGISYTARQKLNLEFPYVAQEIAFTGAGTATGENRSFETVINGARSNSLVHQESNSVYCKGVYFIENISRYIGSTANLATNWGDGLPNASADYVFCTAEPPNITGQSTDRLNTYYDCTLTLTTATAPDWDN
jgi:hypothetical protein